MVSMACGMACNVVYPTVRGLHFNLCYRCLRRL